uniref:Uncharacterized protein n=1 Tax=Kwoniella bestiolae CBS 10118 TaxID=1296100 RepID=A0A1B9FY00_9TREE|nr:hypothetical protein I302_06627 [Kwoniella bestiolae CBS 10118]OCF23644.1 hypothetical protein I302_06627 [Kwoniella bestiolae CBS 10118]
MPSTNNDSKPKESVSQIACSCGEGSKRSDTSSSSDDDSGMLLAFTALFTPLLLLNALIFYFWDYVTFRNILINIGLLATSLTFIWVFYYRAFLIAPEAPTGGNKELSLLLAGNIESRMNKVVSELDWDEVVKAGLKTILQQGVV